MNYRVWKLEFVKWFGDKQPEILEAPAKIFEQLKILLDMDGQFVDWEESAKFVSDFRDGSIHATFSIQLGGVKVTIHQLPMGGAMIGVESERQLNIDWLGIIDEKFPAWPSDNALMEFFPKSSYYHSHSHFTIWLWNEGLLPIAIWQISRSAAK